MNRLTMVVLSVWVALAGFLSVNAQPVTTIYSFVRGAANPRAGLTQGRDGSYYGTTEFGGQQTQGTLFKVTTNGAVTILLSFDGYSYGAYPVADLALGPDGNFYGTASAGGTNQLSGGTNNTGVIFKITTNGIVKTLVNFYGANGSDPQAGLILGPDGNFYGTTEYGGTNNDGTVFKVTTNGVLTTLFSFRGTNGANPVASLTLAPGGNFYGTTEYGGTNGWGTVFQVTTNGAFTTLFQFGSTNGAWPSGRMVLGPDGNLYGTTLFGGGTVFELTTNGVLTTLAYFPEVTGTDGEYLYAGLTLGTDGNFYGTTAGGGANTNGTVFQISTNGTLAMLERIPGIQIELFTNLEGIVYYSTNSGQTLGKVYNGTLTTLYSFSPLVNSNNADGANPRDDLTLAPDGSFYGTTYGGGTNGVGATFRITTNGTFAALASLSGDQGYNPQAALTPGPNGILYGVAFAGGNAGYGSSGYGTAFKITTGGALTTLVNFDRFNDGANPQAALIPGPGGNLYGTAGGGGTNFISLGGNTTESVSDGTVFEMTTNGILTALVDFNGTNGANPYGSVAWGPDGNLYGTTTYGGISNDGVIFQLMTNGTLTTLTNFTGANGANPYAGLMLGPDDNFYGTTEAGGTNGDGTVFQVTTGGQLTTLLYFNGTNGANPNDGLTLGPDGELYGTAYAGGTGNYGTVFKMTTSGAMTTLVNFARTNGEFPVGGLALGPDGYLYGTASLGGNSPFASAGTVFKMTTNGALTMLYSFMGSPDGSGPFATLTLQTNSHFIHFYGITFLGGSGQVGTVFRLNLTTACSVPENSTNTFFPLTNEVVWATGGELGLLSASATNGTAQINGSGIVFTPTMNFTGTATIAYTVTDNAGATNYSLITVLVTNVPPVANPDFYSVAENSSANVLNPLANDMPLTSGGVLGLVSVSPTNGTATISGTNVLFTPSANFVGTATIGYKITDNVGGTNGSLITVQVTNGPPVANSQLVTTTENSAAAITLTGSDPNHLSLTFQIVSNPGNGVLSGLNPDTGALTYTPNNNYVGPDSFTFLVNDGQMSSTPATVSITVTAATVSNTPPVANPDFYAVTENTTNTFNPLANDVLQTEGATLSLVSVSPTNGTAMISGTNVVFMPSLNFIGTATIGYTITDNVGGMSTSLITVAVTNIPPVANPDNYGITENTTNTFAVLANDQVLTPGGTLRITAATATNGTVTIAGGTNLIFVPDTDFLGVDTIDYTITDGIGGTNSSSVTVTVTNLPPVANPDFYIVGENTTNALTPLTNDFVRTPGSVLEIVSVAPTNGAATISGGTNIIFTPAAGFVGLATIGYTITDSIGGTNSSLITVNVTNHAPVAYSQNLSTPFNTALAITLTGSDPANFPITFAIATPPGHGMLTGLNTNTGTVTYMPTNNFTGQDSFTFVVNNGLATSVPATVTITVGNAVTADLAVSKSGPLNGVVDSYLVYTITVTNLGPDNATNVLVQDDLPPGFLLFTKLPSNTQESGNVVSWAAFNLPANTGTNFTLTAISLQSGTFINVASATSDASDPNPANNNGTATNSQVQTVVSALADVQVFKTGGTNVQAGGTVNYTITVTNVGPSTASNVMVQDELPAGATFQSASGSYALINNTVTWAEMTLTNGTAVNFSVAVTAPASGVFTNVALAVSSTPDPNPANNNGSSSLSHVVTQVVPVADLVVLAFGPTNAMPGSNFVYSLIVSNAGPSVSSNVVASDLLPASFSFISASAGGVFSNGVVTWPRVTALAADAVTNYTVIVNPPVSGLFTNIGFATSTTLDPNLTNNNGTAPESQVVTEVGTAQFLLSGSKPVFNPQTGLYEQTVMVTNSGTGTVAGFRVYVTLHTPGVTLWNATGTAGGVPYVQYNFPLNPSSSVSMLLQFFDANRMAFTDTLSIVPVIPAVGGNVGTNGSVPVNAVFTAKYNGATRVVIEFASVPGKTYAIIYSSDLVNWMVATPSITASDNITQWYDIGPPETESQPTSVKTRFYRVIPY